MKKLNRHIHMSSASSATSAIAVILSIVVHTVLLPGVESQWSHINITNRMEACYLSPIHSRLHNENIFWRTSSNPCNLEDYNRPHTIYRPTQPEAAQQSDRLVLFLYGTSAVFHGDEYYSILLDTLASTDDVHVVKMAYSPYYMPSTPTLLICSAPGANGLVESACGTCYNEFSRSVVYGLSEDELQQHDEVPISVWPLPEAHSVEGRLTQMLLDAIDMDPNGGWNNFIITEDKDGLHNIQVDWSKVYVIGYSQGSSHAGHLAWTRTLAGALLISGPQEACTSPDYRFLKEPLTNRKNIVVMVSAFEDLANMVITTATQIMALGKRWFLPYADDKDQMVWKYCQDRLCSDGGQPLNDINREKGLVIAQQFLMTRGSESWKACGLLDGSSPSGRAYHQSTLHDNCIVQPQAMAQLWRFLIFDDPLPAPGDSSNETDGNDSTNLDITKGKTAKQKGLKRKNKGF